jgi:hypothetical protein
MKRLKALCVGLAATCAGSVGAIAQTNTVESVTSAVEGTVTDGINATIGIGQTVVGLSILIFLMGFAVTVIKKLANRGK